MLLDILTVVLVLMVLDVVVGLLRHRGPRCWKCMAQTNGDVVLLNGLPMHERCAERLS